MSTDALLRETLGARADSYDLSLASIDEIAGTANRHTRRSRVAGGALALTLAFMLVVGVAGSRQSEASTLMFAGIDGASEVDTPTRIIATDEGWLGATLVFTPTILTPQSEAADVTAAVSGEVYLATSTDGESWELAEPTGLTGGASTIALDDHDGRYWLAVSDDDEVRLAFSDDLVEWVVVDLPQGANDFERPLRAGYRRVVEPATLVASDAGVMLKVDAVDQPDFEAMIGSDLRNVCDLRWDDFGIEVRECGSSDWETHDTDLPIPAIVPRGGDSNLVFSANGIDFEVFGAAEGDTRLPYSAGQRLYETDTGFGLADYLLRETNDGTTWETFDHEGLERLTSPSFVAARGEHRVAASHLLSAPIAELFFTADGDTWASHPIDDLVNPSGLTGLSERSTPVFSVSSLVAGEAGWALAGASVGDGEYGIVDGRDDGPFTAEIGDMTLSGVIAGGPAELTDAAGQVLQRWDRFEPRAPWRTGVLREGPDYVFVDDDGEHMISVPIDHWNDEIGMTSSMFTYTVLFSADGMNWTKISEDGESVVGISVGDDEVVVATRGELGASSERIKLDEVDG